MSLAKAWRMTREILKDHTSHSWAAFNGWTYTPTAAEQALWDRLELEGRLKRKNWRPWTDPRNDPFGTRRTETRAEHAARLERRHRLNQRFHITEQ